MVIGRSLTSNFSGSPFKDNVLATWLFAKDRTESRVTPGNIIPSRGGVASSRATRELSFKMCGSMWCQGLTAIFFPEYDEEIHRAYL